MYVKTFGIDAEEAEIAEAFKKEHDAKHGWYAGAIGARYTYTFTPSGVGTFIWIECGQCGGKDELTKNVSW
jgi:hypothetical protein